MKVNSFMESDAFAVKLQIEENGQVAGRVRVYILSNDLHNEPFALMEDLFVDEKFRKQGIGRKLVEAALEEAKKNNCYKFIFTCSHSELFGWYERLGFKKYGAEFRLDI